MPGYPFAEERYWVAPDIAPENSSGVTVTEGTGNSHSLPDDENKRGLVAHLSISLQGQTDVLLTDVDVSHRRLPGLVLPELARSALEKLHAQPVRALKHLLWSAPIHPDRIDQDLDILISTDEEGYLYRIAAEGAEETPYHLAEQISENEEIFQPDDRAPDQFITGHDVSSDFMSFYRLSGAANGSVQIRAVYRDADVLTARLERVSNPEGLGGGGVFDIHYLTTVGLLAAFRQGGEFGESAVLPSAMRSMISYGLLKDSAWLRIWNRPDGNDGQPMTAIFYGDDGSVRLALNDLYLTSEGQGQIIELNS